MYCGRIGIEYMHIQVLEERQWIQQKFEHPEARPNLTRAAKKEIWRVLTAAETFERFLERRYSGSKRFGIEGAESLMPALEAMLRRGAERGVAEFVIGMPHRGRLNVLANFMGKPFAQIFSEFQGTATNPDDVHGSGDVKYHLGTSGDREFGGRNVHLSLAANPSHLEAVNPVVLGKVRSKQHQRGDSERKEDVVIDLLCYPRHGHNESDEPAFTQPLMYRTIAQHKTARQLYAERLVADGVLGEADVAALASRFVTDLESQFAAASSYRPNKADWLEGAWAGLEPAPDDDRRSDTAGSLDFLREGGHGLVTVPEGFHLNR